MDVKIVTGHSLLWILERKDKYNPPLETGENKGEKDMDNTTIQYPGISGAVDQFIKDYCEDCGMTFADARFDIPSKTRTIEWDGVLTIGEELELVDTVQEHGVTLTIITEE